MFLKKNMIAVFVSIAFLTGCGTGTKGSDSGVLTDSGQNLYTDDYTGNYTDDGSVDYNCSKIKVTIDENGSHIEITPYDLDYWGTYIVGSTCSDTKNGVYYDNPIEVIFGNGENVECSLVQNSDENDTNVTDSYLTYYCYGEIDTNGMYFNDDGVGEDDGIQSHYLYIYKNFPTYLYERTFIFNTAYIVGEFDYENNSVVYVPYDSAVPVTVQIQTEDY
jgi:hypothetical protein